MKKSMAIVIAFYAVSVCQGGPLPDYPFVFAQGGAKAEMKPDICEVSCRIEIRNKSASEAQQRIAKQSAAVLGILADHDVKKEDIEAYEINKQRIRDYEQREKFEFLGYEMSRRIEFTLRDLSKYESIVSLLLDAPDVVDIETDFDRTDRKEIESQLVGKAVADARSRAEILAKGAKQRIVKLRALSQDGFSRIAEHFGLGEDDLSMAMYSMDSAPEPDLLFVPSTIEFSSSVSVIYEIE